MRERIAGLVDAERSRHIKEVYLELKLSTIGRIARQYSRTGNPQAASTRGHRKRSWSQADMDLLEREVKQGAV